MSIEGDISQGTLVATHLYSTESHCELDCSLPTAPAKQRSWCFVVNPPSSKHEKTGTSVQQPDELLNHPCSDIEINTHYKHKALKCDSALP